MRNFYNKKNALLRVLCCGAMMVALLTWLPERVMGQAVVSNPMAIGLNCNRTDGSNFKVFSYAYPTLTSISNCLPDLANPDFSPSGGSIAFSPADQKIYYIETTNGNNSIIWSWTPGTCPTHNQAALYTYSNAFIVGLDFNPVTGDGYQIEFVGSSAPYSLYLRKILSFSPFTPGTAQIINLPAGKKIYQQNGDVVMTPTGQMFFGFNNKLFTLDYSTYGPGVLNATYIDTLMLGTGVNLVGLSYINGKLLASATNNGSQCIYKEINMSTSPITLQNVDAPDGTSSTRKFSTLDMASLITGVGASKKVAAVIYNGGTNYTVVYHVKIKNYGNVNLTDVQLTDNVKGAFGSVFGSAVVSAVGSLPPGLTLNPSFNGNTNTNIFSSGGTMKATPQDSAVVRITVTLNNPSLGTTYNNSATASAKGALFNNNVTDLSDDQLSLNPDANRNDVPDDANEDTPTPLNILAWGILANRVVDFNAELSGKQVNLDWSVTNTDEVLQMNPQRSTDGVNFTTLKTLTGKLSNAVERYGLTDAEPLTGVSFYRVQFKKASGESFFSESVKIVIRKDQPDELQVSPVPFKQRIKFSINLTKTERLLYRIVDFGGREILNGERLGARGENDFSIDDLTRLKPGVYVLQVKTSDQFYKKVISKIE